MKNPIQNPTQNPIRNSIQNMDSDIENFMDEERTSNDELLNPIYNSTHSIQSNQIQSNQINNFEISKEDVNSKNNQKNNTIFTKVWFFIKQTLNCILAFFSQQKNDIYNKFFSITLHIFIMVVFEIYFYFNYVIEMEREAFISKINAYFSYLYKSDPSYSNIDDYKKDIFYQIINLNYTQTQLNNVHDEYIESLNEQNELYNKLLTKACYIAGFIGLILVILFLNAIYNNKVIKWRWIIVENILMLIFLGLFEYVFFVNIIMHYNPITDAELKYIVITDFIKYFNQTS
jgi:hypothetical protein